MWRWMSSGGTKKRLPRATAAIVGQRFQSSSHSGRAASMPLATMASGLAAMTASTLTVGARVSSAANTFSPPQRRIALEMICLPPMVASGCFQIW